MFAENIIQAGLEQVKTTRGLIKNWLIVFFYFICLEYSYIYNNITNTNVTKVKFVTRYVAGANFLG